MQYKFFTIPVWESEETNEELNKFLQVHKVINVEKKWLECRESAYWCVAVEYVNELGTSSGNFWQKKEKVDYKSVLNQEAFKVFARLREIRKQIAESDAVPAYAVFTDAELAEIAVLPPESRNEACFVSSLMKIDGIGKKKVEKYGDTFCKLFNEKVLEDETGGTTH